MNHLAAPDSPEAVRARRGLFPRGLAQPEGGFRFAADTLLLSAFAARHLRPGRGLTGLAGLDLGCGCGAASFGLMLLPGGEGVRMAGVDSSPAMAEAARENARALGLEERFAVVLADVAAHRPAQVDFALCNPPFRKPGTGRACADPGREAARFEGPGGFAAFAACAARGLKRGGQLFLVHLTERLPELFRVLEDASLQPRGLLPVQGAVDAPARLSLIRAVRGGGSGLALAPALALYDGEGRLTPAAGEFCPHLLVNPRRGAKKTCAPGGCGRGSALANAVEER